MFLLVFQPIDNFSHADRRATFHEQVDMIRQNLHEVNDQSQFCRLPMQQGFQPRIHRIDQHGTAVLRAPHHMIFQTENRTRVFGVSLGHQDHYTPGISLTQEKGKAANAASLFRCRLKEAVPEA